MGVRINGEWHEELADPESGGSDEGNGRNFDSSSDYQSAWASNSTNQNTDTSTINDTQQNIEYFNQQAEALKNQAAATAAEIAYKYWHDNQVTIPGLQLDKDKFAFQKAVQAADEAYRTADLDLRKLAEQHGHEIETGKLDLSKLAEKHQHELGIANLGLDVMKLVAGLQADPFRQQEVINGLNQRGFSNAVGAAIGMSEQGVGAGTNGSAADTRTAEYLAARLGAGSGTAFQAPTGGGMTSGLYKASPTPGGVLADNNTAYNANLNALPESPNQIVARNFNKDDTVTKQFMLSGLSSKNGLSMDTNNELIQQTLPRFKAPTGSVATS